MGLKARNWKSKVKVLSLDVWLLFGTNDNRLKKKKQLNKKNWKPLFTRKRVLSGTLLGTLGSQVGPKFRQQYKLFSQTGVAGKSTVFPRQTTENRRVAADFEIRFQKTNRGLIVLAGAI